MTGIELAILKAATRNLPNSDRNNGVAKLAEHLGVTRQVVQHWRRWGYVPEKYVVEIEAEYGIPRGKLMRPQLRDLTAGAFE